MKKLIFLLLLQTLGTVGYTENLRFKQFGTAIPTRPDLVLRWGATNSLPSRLWVYHLLPANFSLNTIATLMTIGSFTDKDRTDHGTNELRFTSLDKSRSLFISFPLGVISYEVKIHYGPSNLTENVPDTSQSVELTKDLLPKLGVKLSEIDTKMNGGGPDFRLADSVSEYYARPATITNVEFRRVGFIRSVDGAPFLGAGCGGDGDVEFGAHGQIIQIYLSWRNLERNKSYPVETSEDMMKSLREGKAVQGWLPENSIGIDWPTAKSVTINKARLCYYAGNPLQSSDWLYPFAALSTTVDTGRGNVDVEIDCPIIDEEKTAAPK